ncbi:phosphopantetheine-binding protein [Mucisphaera sp.]|uniref:phosphopantetheine-binding protein n=1 Tax=Mucisphaera sp. TaxID=2913024 RepID=UPI003D0C3E69
MGLDAVELVMKVEEHFDVSLPERELSHARTIADLAMLVHRTFMDASESKPQDELPEIIESIRHIAADHTGYPLNKIKPDSSFAEDLKMD